LAALERAVSSVKKMKHRRASHLAQFQTKTSQNTQKGAVHIRAMRKIEVQGRAALLHSFPSELKQRSRILAGSAPLDPDESALI
jgi:hypothetical protein